jgi:hypothetical protein
MKRGKVCKTFDTGGENYAIQHFGEIYPEGRYITGDLVLERSVILKRILKAYCIGVQTSIQYLNVWCSGELL